MYVYQEHFLYVLTNMINIVRLHSPIGFCLELVDQPFRVLSHAGGPCLCTECAHKPAQGIMSGQPLFSLPRPGTRPRCSLMIGLSFFSLSAHCHGEVQHIANLCRHKIVSLTLRKVSVTPSHDLARQLCLDRDKQATFMRLEFHNRRSACP